MEISVEFDKGNAAVEPWWWEEVHQIPLHLFCVCDGATPDDAQGFYSCLRTQESFLAMFGGLYGVHGIELKLAMCI